MGPKSRHGIGRFAYFMAAITITALIVSASLVVAPVLETTRTSTSTSIVTTTLSQARATSTLNFTTTIHATTTVVESSTPSPPCDTLVWNASYSGTPSGVPVLLMRPNSTGYVCVTYRTAFDFNLFSVPNPQKFYPFPVGGLCNKANGVTSCGTAASHSFQNGVTPSHLSLSGNLTLFTVVYVVTALSNSTGFYNYGAVGIGCEALPMAVGYSSSQVNASDFSLPPLPMCPAAPFWPFAEYVTGMNVTYISPRP